MHTRIAHLIDLSPSHATVARYVDDVADVDWTRRAPGEGYARIPSDVTPGTRIRREWITPVADLGAELSR